MSTEPNDDAEPAADSDANLDIQLRIKAPAVRALLKLKNLDASVATELQSALEKQAPTIEVLTEQARRAVARHYRTPGAAT